MNISQPQVYCPNPNCSAPLNKLGNVVCENCQTPLVYRYLWVVGEAVLTVPVNSMVAGRYYVKAPQVWLDTQPSLQPDFPTVEMPDDIQTYLYLYPYRLHIPEVFGVSSWTQAQTDEASSVILLENAPIDDKGNLYPTIAQAWTSATAVRQVYWLWQLLQLWEPLAEQGAKASLLVADNIRVEGWRVRLCQLFWDEGITAHTETASEEVQPLTLADLAILWLGWVDRSHAEIADSLRNLCYEMRSDQANVATISEQLNQLLLRQSAQLPLRLQVISRTDAGPQHQHNEDSCYPPSSIGGLSTEDAAPRLAVVCDGIGGHEGGEVASQMAVQSLKLQVPALLTEMAEQPEPLTPAIVAEQLEAIVRVINDLISTQNDTQKREARRRMGTTLVMGLQLPQKVSVTEYTIAENSHELYLVNVGDSRAYWITPRYCHCLTLDDDVAVREVRMGRMLYREALQRSDAGSLIQALGTRDSEFLHPSVQRFILEEDGILLLCSDGLSDNGWVEARWNMIMADVFRGKRSLDQAAEAWIQLANEKNGHDNATVALLRCHVSSPHPELQLPTPEPNATSDWADSARALLESETTAATSAPEQSGKRQTARWLWFLLLVAVLVVGGWAIWSQVNSSNQQKQEQVAPTP
ncbi:MAG: PP2C family serine/threonine-protein phosphatase [Leptolyngbyaceae cyanobacterium bins.302]|nr:PP2C family serine/threonine-protein phosphatase [Leptolyngbyaceae cyanobacterium bins.302]